MKVDIYQPSKYNDIIVLENLKQKLVKTRETFKTKFEEIIKSNKDRESILDELTEALILADVGIDLTDKIINRVRDKTKKTASFAEIRNALKEEILKILEQSAPPADSQPHKMVIMMVGVNGGGKTTSLAKLAYKHQVSGKLVLMAAADTFRAAAREQLAIWGKRLNIPVVQGQYNADPASIVFDAIQSYKSREYDMLLVDTAGRIHTNVNLMQEMEKIRRIILRELETVPCEVLLVLDASIGQNALIQAREFLRSSGLTGIFLSKLDGTAKGGSVIRIADELDLPIKYIGVGESEKDLMAFSPNEFVDALLS
ncbi:MAG: signal recognition particle-docking protein FtsY [Candidatus Aminicenantes bacterium]|nr:signal recognition particle-docking protein FtsY [Candidatus Aminicenantes bacterium]